jgi:N utilization substance protein B
MLFQWDLGRHTPEHVVRTFLINQRLDPDVQGFAESLFLQTVREMESLDGYLRDHSEHWRVERMAAVDRNILRLALFELIHEPDTPASVVINEALEITRRFSGADAVKFVNGVLDAIRKSLPAGPPSTGITDAAK